LVLPKILAQIVEEMKKVDTLSAKKKNKKDIM